MSNYYYEPNSMHDLILHSEALYAKQPFFYSWRTNGFKPASYATFVSDVRRAADWFIAHGYKGKHVMLYGQNSYEWFVCYIAVTAYVGVCIGASKDWKQYDLARGIEISTPDVIIHDESLAEFVQHFSKTTDAFCFSEVVSPGGVIAKNDSRFEALVRKKDDTAVIVFTTGTTSFPKAVPLTLENMFANGKSLYSRTTMTEDDVLYMFLPMHHIYSQVCVSVGAFMVGAKLYAAHDLKNLKEELALSRPTMLSGVPLFFDQVLGAIDSSDMRKIKKVVKVLNLFRASAVVRRKVFAKVHDIFGGRLRVFTSGGAPLSYETKKLYRDIGFVMLEGYGMSEASGVVSAEVQGRISPRSVGKVLDNIQVKIDSPDADGYGELCVKGLNVTAGYLKEGHIDTSCFDDDGYYKTSDKAYVDKANNLFIRGRIGKTMVLSSGENISIDEISLLIKAAANIDKVYLCENRGYLEATLFTKENTDIVHVAIKKMNEGLPRYKRIQKWVIISEYAVSDMK